MASGLDKLKALTSKLDDKLAEKKASVSSSLSGSAEETISTVMKSEVASERPMNEVKRPDVAVVAKSENAERVREENIKRIKELYQELKIYEKSPDFDMIFMYKAMNLSGIGLKDEDFGVIRAGKYIQVIAITYEPDANGKKKAKNISLGYFGKGETLEPVLKNMIIEFVLRWRYEKAFQNVAHYKDLLSKLDQPDTLF
jgi:hypothetical protein